MAKVLVLSDEILGFKKPNADKITIYGEIEEMSYVAVEKLNSKLREICEERALNDKKAEAVASSIFAGE